MTNIIQLLRRINPYIKLFDVSMCDGLQSIPKKYTLSEKKTILHNIINTYKPHSLEIGSIISPRVVPQMKHSYELYKYAIDFYNPPITDDKTYTNITNITNITNKKCKFYLSVPPTKQYLNTAKSLNIKNISLTTSISEKYQQKYIKQSIEKTKEIIKDTLKEPNTFDNVKLYVSCITNCPINGKQDNEHIINQLYEYLNIDGITEVCLTDTCGNIRYSDFRHIIDYLGIEMNYKLDKLSLHLHCNDEKKIYITDKIIEYAIQNNIYKFDVSSFEYMYFGNGNVNIDAKEFNNNLTYDRLYEGIYNLSFNYL
jgi:isopropylmalate/homocitrate/citramalate synthase